MRKFIFYSLLATASVFANESTLVVKGGAKIDAANTLNSKDKKPNILDEDQRAKETDKKKIDNAYKNALKVNNKCDKALWNRYEHAEVFRSYAKTGKITPYDVFNGDPYTRRSLSDFPVGRFLNIYATYVGSMMPEPFKAKFDQEFDLESDKVENQKTVFNALVARDSECYKKLK